jgi:hypothetical protein
MAGFNFLTAGSAKYLLMLNMHGDYAVRPRHLCGSLGTGEEEDDMQPQTLVPKVGS